MKKIYLLFACLFIYTATFAQTITVGGQCMTGTITLNFSENINGKPAYEGTGTVMGTPGIAVSIYWIGAPDNVWVIAFDGQPYFQNTCNTAIPPGTSPQICGWTTIPGGPSCTGPTPLTVTGAVVLPVTLTSFTAIAAKNTVALQWSTAQEINNRGFTIERSADGQNWADIGFVNGAGNTAAETNYRFTDNAPYKGINYYRLRQEDLDGRNSFSAIATANVKGGNLFTISDNPGNGRFKLNTPATTGVMEMTVTDATGRVVLNQKTSAGNQVIDISRQAPGVYWLRVQKGTELATVKLIKL